MEYTDPELADIHLVLGEMQGNAAAARRRYAERYPSRRLPCRTTFVAVDQHLRDYGTFRPRYVDVGNQRQRRSMGSTQRILHAVEVNPRVSTRRVAPVVGVSHSCVWRTLRAAQLYPYHVQSVQGLLPADYPRRVQFCQWVLQQHEQDPQFLNRVLFTDEACFTRSGVFNMHNTHVWAVDNPHEMQCRRHQQECRINVWAGMVDNQLLGCYRLPPRLTGIMYCTFLQMNLPQLLENVSLAVRRRMWFQHDGAPPHYSCVAREYLNIAFPRRWIGRDGPIAWPPRSPDLNPLDYFLWGHLKGVVYATEVTGEDDLWQRIEDASQSIADTPGLWDRVRHSLIRRAEACIEMRGQHFEHLL